MEADNIMRKITFILTLVATLTGLNITTSDNANNVQITKPNPVESTIKDSESNKVGSKAGWMKSIEDLDIDADCGEIILR